MKKSPRNRLATVVGIHCSICDAYATYVITDGRTSVANELRKIGWRDTGDHLHRYICPSHAFAEILEFWQKIKPRPRARSKTPK